MSTRGRGKDAARARAAELRAAQARAERKRRILMATGAIVVVLVIVAALVVVKLTSDDKTGTTATKDPATVGSSVIKDVTSVSPATLDEIGAGGVSTTPAKIDAPDLTADGKPKVLYVGAEYCPFCAAERWPVVVALSRFGTWSGLAATSSSADDAYPNTQTLSFHGATFTSDYLAFSGYETETNELKDGRYGPLDTLPADDLKTYQTYGKPPYVPSAGIPFMDIGGRYASSGATFSPQLLEGMSRAQIAGALDDPTSDVAKAVGGSANVLSAAICDLTDNQPSDVCSSAGVKAGATALAKSQQ